ncbi:MAG: DNA polymerase III subunit theta [Serratia sp. (in: enterobacteria)]|uniref:DNA polymerase III subunit theta n=1 Tax=Serratia sp. (in: enterobacteria) TaxID=616 RepID=UPI003F354B5C
MSQPLDGLPQQERERIQTDLLALRIIYSERYGFASEWESAEVHVPTHLRGYFQQRLNFYRTA